MPPKDLKRIGKCKKCGKTLYYSESRPNDSEYSNVGDYDIVCYPCQFELMDSGKWDDFKARYLRS